MKFYVKRVEISVSILLPIGLISAACFGFAGEYLTAFLMIAFHECAHVACASLFGCKVESISFLPVGLNTRVETGELDRVKRIIINFCGPVLNLVLFIMSGLFIRYVNDSVPMLHIIKTANIYLAIFNMLPVWPLDGSRILQDLLMVKTGLLSAARLIRALSFVMAFILIIAGALPSIYTSWNFSLIAVGIYILWSAKMEKTETSYANIRNVMYRRSKLKNKGIYLAREIVVLNSLCLWEAVSRMDFDRYHIIHVLDDNFSIVRSFTEQEIIDGMVHNNASITFKEFIELLSQTHGDGY